MNWLDIVLLCLAGIGLGKGLFDGVIKQVVSLIALGAGIYFCSKAAEYIRLYIIDLNIIPEKGVVLLSYIIAFILIVGVLVLVGSLLNKVVDSTPLSVINHLVGGFFGLIVMILFTSLVLCFIEHVDKKSILINREVKLESQLYYPIKEIVPTIYPHSLFSLDNNYSKK